MKKYLVFDRPFTHGFTREYPKVAGSEIAFRYVSDFRYRDDVDLIGRQYRYFAAQHPLPGHVAEILHDVIPRDRFLRSLEAGLALRLAYAAYQALNEVLDEERPDIVLGLPIDNYYLHLLQKLCCERGIYNLFPIQSFLPDLTRISNLGEWRKVRTPSEELVDKYYARLQNRSFRPTTLAAHRKLQKLIRLYAREIGKKILFETLKVLKRDPYSFHYNGIFPAPWAITIHSPANLFVDQFFVPREEVISALDAANLAGKRTAFLPLQFSPETTVDYYIRDINFARYAELIDTVIDNIPDDVVLVVKEHPDIYGFRKADFYRRFVGRPNVLLAHVSVTVAELMEKCRYVVVTGGASTGAEAVVKGNTVLVLGGAYYGGAALHELIDWQDLPRWGERLTPLDNDEATRREFVRHILENTLDGPYAFVRPPTSMTAVTHRNIRAILDYIEAQTA